MLNWIIDISLRNRGVVLLAVAAVIVAGAWSLQYLDIDAFHPVNFDPRRLVRWVSEVSG